ncbi:MAG: PEP-CTERM sorting domain-containing protein [Planctomycetota bacterium]
MTGGASAINISIDYSFDSQNFFGSNNPQGSAGAQQARAALEAAADFFSDLLEDTFDPIVTPDPYFSQTFNGQVTWSWNRSFLHPGTGSTVSLGGPIGQDEYLIYAGARVLSGTTLGFGGPGGFGWSSSPSGGFTSQEINELNAITDDFANAVETRGEPSGFSSWGGAVTFDNDPNNVWHFDHLTEPSSGQSDFFSLALHELAHALGFGGTEWEALVSGFSFTGSASRAENGGVNPQVSSDRSHWAENTTSTVRGTGDIQEAAMDPNLLRGTRKLWTDLDTAGLEDIGWDIAALTAVGVAGDYNGSGSVEQGDLNFVLNNWGLARGDWANADGFVSPNIDQEELNRVLNNWGASAPPNLAGAAVPEPSAGLGLAVALSGFAALRRRRA